MSCVHMEVIRQLAGVCFLLPPCGSLGLNPDYQAWQQAPLLTEPPCWSLEIKTRGVGWQVVVHAFNQITLEEEVEGSL